MAKSQGVPGWHSMRKEQLVKALLKQAKQSSSPPRSRRTSSRQSRPDSRSPIAKTNRNSSKPTGSRAAGRTKRTKRTDSTRSESRIAKKIRQERQKQENLKNLALINSLERSNQEPQQDRVIAIVRDSYWIQAYWEVTKTTVARAKVALADEWHLTEPVIRLLKVVREGTANMSENVVQEIKVHGGVRNWYINVADPPQAWRIAIGYLTQSGKFHLIAKSNCVTTPAPASHAFDHHWADIARDHQKYYALSGGYSNQNSEDLQNVFEEKLRRPMNQPEFVRMGNGINNDDYCFRFEVDAHLIVQGIADPTANVTIAGEPVRLEHDGRFSVKLNLPDRRQVLPVVASSRDGTQQRTTVLAIERNTKVMEPVSKDFEEA